MKLEVLQQKGELKKMLGKVIFKISFVLAMLGVMPQVLAADEAPEYAKRLVTVYGNVVATETPVDWPMTPAHEQQSGDIYIMELLPEGQNLETWEEMITILGRKGVEASPRQFFTAMYLQQQQVCTEVNVAAEVFHETPDFLIALLMCGGVTAQTSGTGGLQQGQGEMAVYRIEKRDGNLYMIFKSWRGAAYNVKSTDFGVWPTSIENMGEYLEVLVRSHLTKPISQ